MPKNLTIRSDQRFDMLQIIRMNQTPRRRSRKITRTDIATPINEQDVRLHELPGQTLVLFRLRATAARNQDRLFRAPDPVVR